MSRKSKRKEQKTKTSIGKWLKKIKNIPPKYAELINKNFWELL